MGADYTFYMKTIETHACAFFKGIIFSIGSVSLYNKTTQKQNYFFSKAFYSFLPPLQIFGPPADTVCLLAGWVSVYEKGD